MPSGSAMFSCVESAAVTNEPVNQGSLEQNAQPLLARATLLAKMTLGSIVQFRE
jgi:hypothetical protein